MKDYGLTRLIELDLVPERLSLDVAELALHLLAALDLGDELPLEGADLGVEVDELHQPELAQLRDAVVGGLALQDELAAGHRLRAEEDRVPGDRAHVGADGGRRGR